MLIGMVMTLAAYGRHPVIRYSPKAFGTLLTMGAAAAYLGEFALWPWHADWLNIPVHIVLTLLNTVFFFGGGIVVSGDVEPNGNGIAIREGCLTHRVAELFDVTLSGRSLCSISWTMVAVMLCVPTFTVLVGFFATLCFLVQFLAAGDNPIEMARSNRKKNQIFSPLRWGVFGKTWVPRSPLLWVMLFLGAKEIYLHHSAIPIIIGLSILGFGIVMAIAIGIAIVIEKLCDKHRSLAHENYWGFTGTYEKPADFFTDPIGYVDLIMKSWKEQICPNVTVRIEEPLDVPLVPLLKSGFDD